MSASDSEPFSSPTMLSGSRASPILVFGSQGADFLAAFDAIFVLARYQPQLQSFIAFALDAVRSEMQSVAKVPIGHPVGDDHPRTKEIELLPHLPPFRIFSDLRSLVSYHAETNRTDPVVNGVLLCLLHAANIVAIHCARANMLDPGLAEAWTAISHPHAQLLGLCTGALSAWAAAMISESCEAEQSNVWRYMQAAILSIRISFWVGLRSKASRQRLAKGSHSLSGVDGRWSMVISSTSDNNLKRIQQLLDEFHATFSEHPEFSSLLRITAHALDQVSVSGPPALMQIFARWLQDADQTQGAIRSYDLEIFSPYHHVELQDEALQVLQDIGGRTLIRASDLPPQSKTMWDAANIGFLLEDDPIVFVGRLIASNLCSPAYWDETVDVLLRTEKQQEGVCSRSRAVISLGPGISLAADIKKRFDAQADPVMASSTHVYDVPGLLRDWAKSLESSQEIVLPRRLTDPQVEGDEVVIVSMACRFPGDVRTPEQLWTCLESGRQTVSEIPKHLFDIDLYYGSGTNQTLARHMHALPEDVTQTMDARLFSMSPKEIEQLDPQHRLTMLCSYEALERAGYSHDSNSPSSFDRKRIAVCMGASWDDYRENASHNIGSYFITGNIRAFIPGHVSFSLRWEGPSVSVDTLECTAVSAIEWSRRALLSDQCDVALAGAVNVLTQPQIFIAMDKDSVLSRTGTNATFSTKLDGKTRGDGCGVLLLKRRSTALRDGDTILASLPAVQTASHHPTDDQALSASRQAGVLKQLFTKYGPELRDVTHIEASGCHSQEGEAIEFESFQQMVSATSQPLAKISVSSTRPNLGAGEAVSAMTSVMKAVLMLQKSTVPRHLCDADGIQLQPRISDVCQTSPLFVPTQAQILPQVRGGDRKRCILVNSLASTGHQGALLVQEADKVSLPDSCSDARSALVFTLSARTKESVEGQRRALLDYLQRDIDLRNLSYTLTCRRTHHPFRITVVAASQTELSAALANAKVDEASPAADLPRIGFSYASEVSQPSLEHIRDFIESDEILRQRQQTFESRLWQADKLTRAESFIAHQVVLSNLLSDCGIAPRHIADSLAPAACFLASRTPDSNLLTVQKAQDGTEPGQNTKVKGSPAQRTMLRAALALPDRVFGSDTLPTIRDETEPTTWLRIGDSVTLSVDSRFGTHSTSAMLYRQLLTTFADLHQKGYGVKWIELHRPYLYDVQMLHDLPTYSFHLQRHWMEYHDRNLIRSQDTEDSSVDSTDDSGASDEETDDTEAEECIQPLLSLVIKAAADEVVYRSDLKAEPWTQMIKSQSTASILAELMSEAAVEAASTSNTVAESVTLRNVQLTHFDPTLTNSVYTAADPSSRRIFVSTERNGPQSASCSFELTTRTQVTRSWATTQSLLKDRLTKIVDEGEMLGSRLVQRALDKVYARSSAQQAVRSVSLQRADAVALLSCRTTPDTNAFTHHQLPQLLDALEQCGAWFCSTLIDTSDISFQLCEFQKCIMLPVQDGSLNFKVYAALLENDAQSTHDDRSVTLEMFVLDEQLNIVGELHAAKFRLTAASIPATPAAKTVPVAPAPAPTQAPSAIAAAPIAQPVQATTATGKSKAVLVLNKIVDVLAAELGIAAEEIKPTVKFADLGLDSLMSLVCLSTLETLDLEFAIPQSLFLECDSPGELLTWIRTQVGDEPVPAQPIVSSQPVAPPVAPVVSETTTVPQPASAPSGSSKVDDAMALVVQTLEMELGVETGSLRHDANLADLGMDSLMSLLVLGSLTPQLSFELPPSLFLDCPTLHAVRAFLASALPDAPTPHFTVPPAKAPTLLHAGTDDAQPPLFLMPEGAGMSAVYQFVPALDRAVYGLNSAFLGNAAAWDGGVAQIAQYYYACMQLVQPRGPYLVGGWSFGGMAAFEIARMLAERGDAVQRVAGLVLLHSPCPAKYPPLPMSFVDWIASAPEVAEIAPARLSAKLVAHFQATVDNLALYRPAGISAPVHAVYVVPSAPLPGDPKRAVPQPNATIDWLFHLDADPYDSPDGWETLLPGVHTEVVHGANHFTLVRKPAVDRVAAIIAAHCRTALARA